MYKLDFGVVILHCLSFAMKNKNKTIQSHMKQFVKTAFAALLLTGAGISGYGQEIWSLEKCVIYAQDANLTVQQARSNVKVALLSEQQAKVSRLPSINGNASLGGQFGRTIDPTTNQFIATGFQYNSFGLNAGVPLFNGGQIHHSVKQAGWDAQAAQADAEQTANSLALQVAQAYLNILLTEEQLESANQRVAQSNRQLEATQKLIDAGTIPVADKYNVLAQIARDEQAAVMAANNVDLAYLNIKQLMQLEPDFDLRIERPEFTVPADVNPENYALQPVYTAALETQPNVKAAAFRIKSAEEGVPLAKSAYYPSLQLFGSLTTNYSSRARTFDLVGTELSDPVTFVVNGMPVTIQQEIDVYDISNTPYFTQLDQNYGQGLGVQLSIPIYQNGRNRLNVERARLGVVNAKLQENQTLQQLKNDIQTAIANARSARKQLDAAQKTFDAMQAAFSNTEKRHNLGAVNTLELTTAKTNLDNAENDLLVARYDYLFRLKILDFYQGKELRL
ncbi:MAG: TolC family protein [Bacteroidetes bacterium]|nr:MAG: TolC family protein [Bacteroidota bacterium]